MVDGDNNLLKRHHIRPNKTMSSGLKMSLMIHDHGFSCFFICFLVFARAVPVRPRASISPFLLHRAGNGHWLLEVDTSATQIRFSYGCVAEVWS
jgi:hypothetical protein